MPNWNCKGCNLHCRVAMYSDPDEDPSVWCIIHGYGRHPIWEKEPEPEFIFSQYVGQGMFIATEDSEGAKKLKEELRFANEKLNKAIEWEQEQGLNEEIDDRDNGFDNSDIDPNYNGEAYDNEYEEDSEE